MGVKNKIGALGAKYKGMPLTVRAGLWFTLCSFMQRGITMITTPIFTRVLSEEQYGMVNIFSSWQMILFLVATLSLYKASMNLYVKYEDKDAVVTSISGLSLIITMVWFVLSIIFRKPLSKLLGLSEVLTICLFATFIGEAVIQNWSTYKRYIYDYRRLIAVTLIITAGSSFLGVLCVLLIEPTTEARLIPQTLVTVIVGLCLYASIFSKRKPVYHRDMWVFSVTFCLGLMPHYLSEFILSSSDKLMINYMCGTRDVAIYSIAYAAGSLINLITNAINSTFAPYQYQKIKEKAYKELSERASQVLMGVAVMLVLIMLFSREIVLIFGGHKYIESVYSIIPISIGIYFNYLFQLFARVQEYYERKITVVVPSILCALLNIILNYIFIRLCGYQAAAYTTFACYMIFCMLHYFFYRKVCREELNGTELYNIRSILAISGFLLISGVGIALITDLIWVKYSVIALLAIAAVIKRNDLIAYVKHAFLSKG